MPITNAALKSEIQTDPLTYGYMAAWNASEPETVVALLNKVRDGTDGEAAITVRRADISAQEIFGALDMADYPSLTGTPTATQLSAERKYLAWLSGLAAQSVVRLLNDDGTDGPVIANLKALFPASPTRTRLVAIASRFGSRSEQLGGSGTIASVQHVTDAMRS